MLRHYIPSLIVIILACALECIVVFAQHRQARTTTALLEETDQDFMGSPIHNHMAALYPSSVNRHKVTRNPKQKDKNYLDQNTPYSQLQRRSYPTRFENEYRNVTVFIDPHMPANMPAPSGRYGRFVNLSNRSVFLYLMNTGDRPDAFIRQAAPMAGVPYVIRDGERYKFIDEMTREMLATWTILAQHSLYVYDVGPYHKGNNDDGWSATLIDQYEAWHDTIDLAPHYQLWTGRPRFSHAHRPLPTYPFHRADYVGQTIQVKSTNHYSTTTDLFNLTVLHMAPRMYEIKELIDLYEISEIVQLGLITRAKEWTVSKTGSVNKHPLEEESQKGDPRRNSRTMWLESHLSPVLLDINKRIAEIMQIPYERFRISAEPLQMVHYEVKQEYKSHYDFGFPPVDHPLQPNRYATIIIYLNEGYVGGETYFPRVNQYIKPEMGNAVLFYNMLPDGNMDDLVQHAALPIIEGEKFMMNLWIWDPVHDADAQI